MCPSRSGINFNKFEDDFVKSRQRHHLIRCNRTVGHTSLLKASSHRDPFIEAYTPLGGPPASPSNEQRQRGAAANTRDSPKPTAGPGARSTQRPQSAESSFARNPSGRPGGTIPNVKGSNTSQIPRTVFKRVNAHQRDDANTAIIPQDRPHTAGPSRKRPAAYRPHTAPSSRRGAGHHDLFDARAADPGWAGASSGCQNLAARPPSAPDRVRWGRSRYPRKNLLKSHPSAEVLPVDCRLSDEKIILAAAHHRSRPERVVDGERRSATPFESLVDREETADGRKSDMENDERETKSSCRSWCLGRTKLAEARALVATTGSGHEVSQGTTRKGRCGRTVGLKCFSLDGLARQRGHVRRTLQGFVVEASVDPRHVSPICGAAQRSVSVPNGARKTSASVIVSAVQAFLKENSTETEESNGRTETCSPSLIPFRDANPLDGEETHFPEIDALLSQTGLRHLLQALLESCRVDLNAGADGISLNLLHRSSRGSSITRGLGISASVMQRNTSERHPKFPQSCAQDEAKERRSETIDGSKAICGRAMTSITYGVSAGAPPGLRGEGQSTVPRCKLVNDDASGGGGSNSAGQRMADVGPSRMVI